jgi:type I restriction enzyme S subunit
MSRTTNTTVTKGEAKPAMVPRLRFPEFRYEVGWAEYHMSRITTAIFDGTHQTPTYTDEGVPFYSVENLVSGNANKFISKDDYELATKKNKPEKDDVLITRIGKIGYSQVVTWSHDFSIYVTLAVIKKDGRFNSQFLNQFIQSAFYQKEIFSKSLLSAVPCKINMDSLRETRVLLPSPAEQQKIADCLSSLDTLITTQSQKLDALRDYKKGLMQQLFPREGESQSRLRFPEFRNDGEWARMSIQEMIDRQFIVGHLDGNHGELYPKAEEFSQNKEGIPYITANDFMNGSVEFSRCKRLPIERARLFKKGVAKDGDILFAHNATVGPVAKLNTSEEFVILSTTATYFRCNSTHLSNDFLKSALSSPDFVAQYSRVMSQSTRNQVPITTQRKLELYVPKPPEQQRIASCLISLDALITAETQKLDALKTHKNGLMQQLFPAAVEE